MPRPCKPRSICCYPDYWSFSPDETNPSDLVILSLDEFETIRLIDYCHKTQEQCACEMNVARTTITSMYDNARKKLAQALIEGKRLVLSGGHYTLSGTDGVSLTQKGTQTMRIAVTYENGQIFPHFGRTTQFKLYDIENGTIAKEQVVDTNGAGHGALATFLKQAQADVLICGGIGGGAQMAMQEAGITLFGGNTGSADDAVAAYLAHTLVQNTAPTCNHHGQDHEHSCHGPNHGTSCHAHRCGDGQ